MSLNGNYVDTCKGRFISVKRVFYCTLKSPRITENYKPLPFLQLHTISSSKFKIPLHQKHLSTPQRKLLLSTHLFFMKQKFDLSVIILPIIFLFPIFFPVVAKTLFFHSCAGKRDVKKYIDEHTGAKKVLYFFGKKVSNNLKAFQSY